MKNKLILLLIALCVLTGCGKEEKPQYDYTDFKQSMTDFFKEIEETNNKFSEIDASADNSTDLMREYLKNMEQSYKKLAEIEPPEQYKATESLADEAYNYIIEANKFYDQSFAENSLNEYTLEAANECLSRARLRLQYIIGILHNDIPEIPSEIPE